MILQVDTGTSFHRPSRCTRTRYQILEDGGYKTTRCTEILEEKNGGKELKKTTSGPFGGGGVIFVFLLFSVFLFGGSDDWMRLNW